MSSRILTESEYGVYFDELGLPLAMGTLVGSLFILAALGLAFARILRGPTSFDRVVALDLIGGTCLCAMIFFAIYFDQQVLMDAAFAIAVVSFIGTVAFARYLGGGEE